MAAKTVLITGCSAGGIGSALVLSFQRRGYTVYATARSLEKMADLVSLPNVYLLELDVTSPSSIISVAKELEGRTGGTLDVLINNAGQQYIMPVLDVDIETAKNLFEVNYWGPLRTIQAFSTMLIRARGCIVNIGSAAGVLTIPMQSKWLQPGHRELLTVLEVNITPPKQQSIRCRKLFVSNLGL
jgi:1-acylglycerone phosphate reductase